MTSAENAELVDRFEEFYRNYYRDDIGELAQKYPNEQQSLYIDHDDLYSFDPDMADDFIAHPNQMRDYAEEALRLYDLPVDVKLGQAHVRVHNLTDTIAVRDLSSKHTGQLVAIEGMVAEATDVEPHIQNAAFECQRCGTLTRIPQSDSTFQEPHECLGCEQQGPFQINTDQSEFVDKQNGVLQDVAAERSTPPGTLTVHLADDVAGALHQGEQCIVTGIVRLEQQSRNSGGFTIYLQGMTVEPQERDIPASEQYLGDQLPDELPAGLGPFVKRSRYILNTVEGVPAEEATKARIITPFLYALGWNCYDPAEVDFEYEGESQEIGGKVDYALFGPSGQVAAVVEAKRAGRPLGDSATNQLKGYMRTFGASLGLLTNGERYLLYQTDTEATSPTERRILDCELEELLTADLLLELTRQRFYDMAFDEACWLEQIETELDEDTDADRSGIDLIGVSKSTQDRSAALRDVIETKTEELGDAVEKADVFEAMAERGYSSDTTEKTLKALQKRDDVYQPKSEHYRTT